MKILKFGGKSLDNGVALENSVQIIKTQSEKGKTVVVCSARGQSTDNLELMLEKAAASEDFLLDFENFCRYQTVGLSDLDLTKEFSELKKILEGVAILDDYSLKVKDLVLSFGEILSCKTIAHKLTKMGLNAFFTDSRQIIKTDKNFGSASVILDLSEKLTIERLKNTSDDRIEIVSGFIGSTIDNYTTTLGRNGSNYSATLLASFLDAREVQNWTNVSGVYTANPSIVADAKIIHRLSFAEANELANLGTNVLHAKTILPLLDKKIPIRILNSFKPDGKGTMIASEGSGEGLKAISTISDVALITIEGRGLLGKIGIDGRIFSCLSKSEISVMVISQASSERGISFVVRGKDAEISKSALEQEFSFELQKHDISSISVKKQVDVISIIGKHTEFLDKAYGCLRTNNIIPYLINNTINSEHLSLVVDSRQTIKAVNVVHNQLFGVAKKLNILIFGCGGVGSTLIDQILSNKQNLEEKRNLKINIVGIINSKQALLNREGVDFSWKDKISSSQPYHQIDEIIRFTEDNHLENIVVVDNTASSEFVNSYPVFIDKGFDIVASNKVANTISQSFYDDLRHRLKQKGKRFLYETNVGAGLPLVDTIRQLHLLGDKIRLIRGVFSGTLSYLFNNFSSSEEKFSEILLKAKQLGYTEPDPREDLCGNDVARKLLILARELDLKFEFSDIEIQNLIPENLRNCSVEEFLQSLQQLDEEYGEIKRNLNKNSVLRYVGELDVDAKKLSVSLVTCDSSTSLGSLKGSDSIFEIYTDAYGKNPLLIQGAGAGKEVTARGVYTDILKIAETI